MSTTTPSPRSIHWSELSSFEYAEGTELPQSALNLDGTHVEMRGRVMHAELSTYILFEEWTDHNGPELHELVVLTVPMEHHRFSWCHVVVRGVLAVGERRDQYGDVTSLYRMTPASMWVDGAQDFEHCDSLEAYER